MGYEHYEELDSSGVTWLQKKPKHWRLKKLKFSTDLINSKVSVDESPLPYLGLEHIESWTGRKISGEISNSEGVASAFSVDDVLFGKLRPYLAKVHTAQHVGLISSEALVIRCKDELHPNYLKYFMLSPDFINIVDSSTYGSKMPRASWDFVGNLPVLLPDIQEQRVIATFLDLKASQIDALIAKQKTLLEKLAEKHRALICHVIAKGLDPSVPMKESTEDWLGEVPAYWKTIALHYVGRLKSGESITALQFSEEGKYPVFGGNGYRGKYDLFTHDGDYVLIGRQGALCGNVNIASGKFFASEHAIVVNPEWDFETNWMAYQLTAMNLNQYSVSAAQPGLSTEVIGRLKIAFPPFDEQRQIALFLNKEAEKIQTQRQKIEEVIARLQEYRAALITNAVTGKIDVRGFAMPTLCERIA
jgi:type I restriction enzyme, S subunit